MLQNEYLDAKIGVDTAENEPSKVCPIMTLLPDHQDPIRPRPPRELPLPQILQNFRKTQDYPYPPPFQPPSFRDVSTAAAS